MSRSALIFGGVAAFLFAAPFTPLQAADLAVPAHAIHARSLDCGPCGCLRVVYVRHPDIQQTYGTGFDPRNYDETEPHFYLGRVRAYPHYFVEGPVLARPPGPDCRF